MPYMYRMTINPIQILIWLCIFSTGFFVASLEPGYLDFDNLPDTNFSCVGKVIGGYYADLEANCQMFHVCTIGQLDEPMDIRFLCLNGTVFDQETRVCERIDEVDCSKSEKFYSLNLELYGNTQPSILEENVETDPPVLKSTTTTTLAPTTTTTTTKRPTTKSPQYYTSSIRPITPSPYHKGPSPHQFSINNQQEVEYTPEEINISLNPGTPPNIRTKLFEYPRHPYSDVNKKILVTTHNPVFRSDKKHSTTESVKKNITPRPPQQQQQYYDFEYEEDDQESDHLPHNYQYQSNIANFRPPGLSGNSYSNNLYGSSTHRNEYLPVTRKNYEQSSTIRNFFLQPIKSPSHQYFTRTEKPTGEQLPLPVIPTLSPIVFSSPAPFTLSRSLDSKNFNDHELPPRIIISASASVSDASGRTLNYSLGTIGAAQILAQPPSSYDDYKEDDVVLDPFFHDVPKVKNKRSKRDVNPSDIIKSEDEAIEVLKFLFDWYKNHEKTTESSITIPVSPDVITSINKEFSQKPYDDYYLSKEQNNENSLGHSSENYKPTETTRFKQTIEHQNGFGNLGQPSVVGNKRQRPYRGRHRFTVPSSATSSIPYNYDYDRRLHKHGRGHPRIHQEHPFEHQETEESHKSPKYFESSVPYIQPQYLEQRHQLTTPSVPDYNLERHEYQQTQPTLAPSEGHEDIQYQQTQATNTLVTDSTVSSEGLEDIHHQQTQFVTPLPTVETTTILEENEEFIKNTKEVPLSTIESTTELKRTTFIDQIQDSVGTTLTQTEGTNEDKLFTPTELPITTKEEIVDTTTENYKTTYVEQSTQSDLYKTNVYDQQTQSQTSLDEVKTSPIVETTTSTQEITNLETQETILTTPSQYTVTQVNETEFTNPENTKSTNELQQTTETPVFLDTFDYINDNYEPLTYSDKSKINDNKDGVHEETNININFETTKNSTESETETIPTKKYEYVDEKINNFDDIVKSLQHFKELEENIYNYNNNLTELKEYEDKTTEITESTTINDATTKSTDVTLDKLFEETEITTEVPLEKLFTSNFVKEDNNLRYKGTDYTETTSTDNGTTFFTSREETTTPTPPKEITRNRIRGRGKSHFKPTVETTTKRRKNRRRPTTPETLSTLSDKQSTTETSGFFLTKEPLTSLNEEVTTLATTTEEFTETLSTIKEENKTETPENSILIVKSIENLNNSTTTAIPFQNNEIINTTESIKTTEQEISSPITNNLIENYFTQFKITTDYENLITTPSLSFNLIREIETTTNSIAIPDIITTKEIIETTTTSENTEKYTKLIKEIEDTTNSISISKITTIKDENELTTLEPKTSDELDTTTLTINLPTTTIIPTTKIEINTKINLSEETGIPKKVHIHDDRKNYRYRQKLKPTTRKFSTRHRFSSNNITTKKYENDVKTDQTLSKNLKLPITNNEIKKDLTTPLSMLYKVQLRKEKVNKEFIFNCFGKKLNTFYSDPRDCRLFHYCTGGYTKNQLLDMKFVCDLGTHFDDEKLVCTRELPKRCL